MSKKMIALVSVLSIVTIASAGVATYSYIRMQSVVSTTNKPDEDQVMLKAIGSFMVLPSEKPTIVSVTDREKLQNQEFFKKAENGDKVVIYESIKRVFLYRPTIRKVIDVAPLVFNDQKPLSVPTVATASAEEHGNFNLAPAP
jgi:hypothetical protein